jgi:hypothetical protein
MFLDVCVVVVVVVVSVSCCSCSTCKVNGTCYVNTPSIYLQLRFFPKPNAIQFFKQFILHGRIEAPLR